MAQAPAFLQGFDLTALAVHGTKVMDMIKDSPFLTAATTRIRDDGEAALEWLKQPGESTTFEWAAQETHSDGLKEINRSMIKNASMCAVFYLLCSCAGFGLLGIVACPSPRYADHCFLTDTGKALRLPPSNLSSTVVLHPLEESLRS